MRDQEILGLYEAYNQVYSEGSFDNLIDTGASLIKKPVQDYANRKIGGLAGTLGIPGAVAGRRVDQTASDLKKGNYGRAVNTVVSGVRTLTQSYDLYDVILSHLVAEGYADTEEAAIAIMANMSEEWRQSIVEDIGGNQYTPNPIGNAIKTGAGLIKKVLGNPSSSGGTSTRPGDGKPYQDGPLLNGPKTPTKPPVQRGPEKRDEPLW